ncbi:PRC-barrel domain-containing protein [Streptomyces sp. NPDC047108]|uniref:PRC-barrel domain-containing protein n=1 Tax=Streptomyces sp. NPDC047108 TaxID=3155025 RepID=UPI003408C949
MTGALMLATEITKRPVVTLGGDAVGQVKDVVFDGAGGRIVGFTLSGRKWFSGPMKQSLPWTAVHGLGRDALMIRSEDVLETRTDVVEKSEARGGDVLQSRVLTDAGTDIGRIVDVVVDPGAGADVVGYEIAPTEALGRRARTVFLPRAETIAVSGEALVVPATVTEYVAEDLATFEERVRAYRDRPRATEA